MLRNQTFRLFAGSLLFLMLCQAVNQLLDPPLICNEGIGLGIGLPVFALIPLVFFALIATFFFIRKILQSETIPPLLVSFGSAILMGGAFSNIIDRLVRGCVPDFFHIGWFPAFNVADIGVSIGAIFLAISILRNKEI